MSQTIAERYRLRRVLGRGGTGRVLEAQDILEGRDIALKLYRGLDEEAAGRFEREAEIAKQLDHERCVKVFDAGFDPKANAWYLSMELLPGGSLSQLLKKHDTFSPQHAMMMMLQVAEALSYTHERGVVHLDLKPSNILFSGNRGDIKLADFGQARIFSARGLTAPAPIFLSPEQARGEATDSATDIFAWGVLCYRLLTGHFPSKGETTHDVLLERATGAASPPIEASVAELDASLSTLIMRALEPDPDSRPSADELVDRVTPMLDTLSARPLLANDAQETVPATAANSGPAAHAEPGTLMLNASAAVEPMINTEVREWEIHEELGRGGHGLVFRAHHRLLSQDFAIKVLHPQLAEDPVARERFLREARLLVTLHHPNLVASLAPFEADGQLYLPMELLEGRTLEQALEAGRRFSIKQSLSIVLQTAEAIGVAHKAGALHRDLKPSNIFLINEDPPQVKVMDFGLARENEGRVLTNAGSIVGTPQYLAPEVLRSEEATPRADIYALGLVLYELIEGTLPWKLAETKDMWALLKEVMAQQEAGAPELPTGVPATVRDLVERCLSITPDERPTDGSALVGEIMSILSEPLDWSSCPHCGLRHRQREDGRCPKCKRDLRPKRSQRWVLIGLAAAVQIALLASVAIIMGFDPTEKEIPLDSTPAASEVKQIAAVERPPFSPTERPTKSATSSATPTSTSAPSPPSRSSLPLKGPPVIESAKAEVKALMADIVAGQMRFFARTGRFLSIEPDGPGSVEAREFQGRPCAPECTKGQVDKCKTFACLGVAPKSPVHYKYACTAEQEQDRRVPAFTCSAAADLDGDGKTKLFVYGSGKQFIRASIPKLGDPNQCAPGKTKARLLVDCEPSEW